MTSIANDPSKAGKRAARAEFFGAFSRYAVFPVHTRFDAVQWFVTDAERDDSGLAAVIRQAATKEEALRGLAR